MSCDYCESGKNMKRDTCSDVSIAKINGAHYILYSDGYRGGATEPIRFCPMCGEQFPCTPPDSFERIKEDMTLNVCEYAEKRGIKQGSNECESCKWHSRVCSEAMRGDLSNRLGKLLDKEDER
jgi:hypothetical protein|nr:MAG TPA: tax1-binding protein [Caudoviricetes sp.]